MMSNEAFERAGQTLDRHFQETGVSGLVSDRYSQFLDLDGYLFAEVVLMDATRLEEVEGIVRRTADELTASGVVLDRVVRALWEIVDVRFLGPAYSPAGGVRAASEFQVTLKSGSRKHPVFVEVSISAIDVIKREFTVDKISIERNVSQIVRCFVLHELSRGGTSYWSPLVAPRLIMNHIAASVVLSRLSFGDRAALLQG